LRFYLIAWYNKALLKFIYPSFLLLSALQVKIFHIII